MVNFVKIELVGFKSFADKQEIQFNEGVTAIVGPNGCGKSNIADAIRWVLGEQSAKSLRGSSMQDVIFNGTQNRKSLSYCEVSLYFDNTNKIFPSLDYTEVCMTRKLFRSGESEYCLNKQTCRRQDLIQLLHECGVSKSGYSIIGQGKIAEIMNAKPEDRRAIFEEAVGIAASKQQKIENERKLAKTREHIIRIIDITSELEKDLGAKETQAQRTREYLQLASEFKYHEVNTYLYNADNSHIVKDKINTKIKGYEEEQEVKSNDLLTTQQTYDEHQKELAQADFSIQKLNDEILELSVGTEKQSGITSLYNQKIDFLMQENERLTNENIQIKDRIKALNSSIKDDEAHIAQSESDRQKTTDRIKAVADELSEVIRNLSEGESMAQDAQNKVIQSVESLGDIKKNIGMLSGEKNAITSQQSEVLEKMEALAQKRNASQKERDLCALSVEKTTSDIAALKTSIADEENAIRSTNSYISEVNNKIYSLKNEIAGLTANQNIYKGLKESFSGFPDSVRSLMLAGKNNPAIGSKIKGLVASLIKTDSKYEVAIETLLGGSVSNIVTATPDDAQFLINYLKRQGGGRVTFLPVSSMKPRNDGAEVTSALKEKGACGLATAVAKYDKYYDSVVRFLLGNTLICDTIENAVEIAKRHKFAFKIVTLDGDVVNPSGSMTGGSKRRESSNLLSTDRLLADIEKKLESKTAEINALTINRDKSLSQVNEMTSNLDSKNDELNDKKQSLASLKEKLAQLERTLDEVDIEISRNEGAYKQIVERLEQISKQYSDIEINNEKLNEARHSATSDAKKHQSEFETLKNKRDELISENTQLQTTLSAIVIDLENCKEEVVRMKEERAASEQAIKKNSDNIQTNLEIIEINKKEIEKIALSREDQADLNKRRDQLANLQKRKNELNELIKQDDLKRQMLISELNKLAANVSDQKIELTKVDSDLQHWQDHIEEEYGLTYETCLSEKDPEYNISLSTQEMNRIKRRISNLGSINPSAIEEFNALRERYDDYNRQRNDLEAAELDLKSVIKNMSDEMLKTFNEGFELIRVNFKKIFKELFGGGSADLVLDYEGVVDALDAGIEIVAEPPGKKLTKISLLSGGEQALTATAILFAILRLRPMPFCVLDEIEAPLDDANVERVASYLQNFSEETQFVIITHKKVTMEKANTLFGVTMQEKGVSKIISVKLSDISNNSDIAD